MVDELYAQRTWVELVREHWPGISDADVELVLWNATCFPFGTVEQVTAQLIEKYNQSHGDADLAVAIAEKEMLDELNRFRTKYPDDTSGITSTA